MCDKYCERKMAIKLTDKTKHFIEAKAFWLATFWVCEVNACILSYTTNDSWQLAK